jgi:kynurenine formamidase
MNLKKLNLMKMCAAMACVMTMLFAVILSVAITAGEPQAQQGKGGPSHPSVTPEQYERWKVELSNWGRWGKDDQRGTLNLITPAKQKQAAALVKDGVSVSLARDWGGKPAPAVDTKNAYELSEGGNRISVAFHGQTTTHLDGLDHQFYNGKGYNGYEPDREKAKTEGYPRNSIINAKDGVMTRGILYDMPRLKGVPYLEGGVPIYVEDLEAWEKKAGVKAQPGDAIFIRVGRWVRRKAIGPYYAGRSDPNGNTAGLDASVLPWLKARDIALIGSDASPFVHPAPKHLIGAVHDFSIIVLGMTGMDTCDLDALAEAAATRKRWEFMLTVAPLPVVGATGSPANPIATF